MTVNFSVNYGGQKQWKIFKALKEPSTQNSINLVKIAFNNEDKINTLSGEGKLKEFIVGSPGLKEPLVKSTNRWKVITDEKLE